MRSLVNQSFFENTLPFEISPRDLILQQGYVYIFTIPFNSLSSSLSLLFNSNTIIESFSNIISTISRFILIFYSLFLFFVQTLSTCPPNYISRHGKFAQFTASSKNPTSISNKLLNPEILQTATNALFPSPSAEGEDDKKAWSGRPMAVAKYEVNA